MKITNSFNKNHFVLEDKNKIIFQSYKSVVAIYNKNKKELTLGKHWIIPEQL